MEPDKDMCKEVKRARSETGDGRLGGWQKRPGSCCGASMDWVTIVAPMGVPMGWERQELGGNVVVVGTCQLECCVQHHLFRKM